MLLKWTKRIILGLLSILVLYCVLGVVLSFIPTSPPDHNCEKDRSIFVASNGIHLDYFIPIVYLKDDFLSKVDAPLNTAYLSFGWGDKDFYIKTPEWGDLSLTVALRALFVKTPAALHVGYNNERSSYWTEVAVCEHQLSTLLMYIEEEFIQDENEKFIQYPGYGPEDHFFDAKGHFMFSKTCNVWINNGLKKAEIKTSVWSPFDFGILYHLKNQNDRTR